MKAEILNIAKNLENDNLTINDARTLLLGLFGVSGSFYWTTQYYHPDNNFTMDDFLSNYLPEEATIHHIDGTYAEVEYEGRDYGLHAGGNGDSFNHIIRWELL